MASCKAHRTIYRPGEELSSIAGHVTLWRYHFATDRAKPFIHPLTTPGGIELTCFEPWDHQWHRGLWFSWQYINDVNYWEERRGVPKGVGEGQTRFIGPEEVSLTPEAATVRSRYEYIDPNGVTVMEDARELHFATPREDRFHIDWTLTFTAREDVVIRRTPEDWGGYSGISLRTARTMGRFELLNSEGQVGEDTQHQPARWVDIVGAADGGWDRQGGAAFFEHPSNLRAPSSWKTFGIDGFGYINPSPVMKDPISLRQGATLTLRYRVLVHDGVVSPGELDEEYARFAGAGMFAAAGKG